LSKASQRPGEAERLVAEFVAGDEEDHETGSLRMPVDHEVSRLRVYISSGVSCRPEAPMDSASCSGEFAPTMTDTT